MTTGATGQLGLALPVQGELSGTWGDTVNNGLTQYINIAIAATLTLTGDGAVTLANTTGDASASNITSTLAGAGTVTAQFSAVRVSGTTTTKVVTGPSYSKTYLLDNASSFAVTFKASGQTGVSISPGEKVYVYYNATDYVKVGGGGITYGAVKTTTYTAVSNDGVLTNTTGGAFTVNLPATPSTGTQVFIADSAGTWGTNNLTIGRNGSTIAGSATDLVCDINSVSIQCVYDGTTWDIFAQIGANDTAVVTLNGTQTLTNKTLTAPTITSPTITGTGAIAAATVTLSSTLSVTGVSTLTGGAVVQGLTVGLGAGSIATNTAVGLSALAANTSGASNTGLGYQALLANLDGAQNTAVGRAALTTNTSGLLNSAIGRSALLANTTGSYNTAVGGSALGANTTASENNAFGYFALTLNTTGTGNSAFGNEALRRNTTGSSNSSFGNFSLVQNTTGANNTGIGYQALNANTTASSGTAVGHQAGYSNTTGQRNAFFGSEAGYANTTGESNTYIGRQAGNLMTSGNNNTIIGRYNGNQNGLDIRTASNTVVLSDGDGNPVMQVESTGYTVIGYGTRGADGGVLLMGSATSGQGPCVTGFTGAYGARTAKWYAGSNSYVKGGTTYDTYTVMAGSSGGVNLTSGATSWASASDERLKDIIEPITDAATKVSTLRAVIGKYKTDEEGKRRSFLIAQDVQAVLPEAVSEGRESKEDETAYLQVSYTDVIPLLVAAIKELKAEFDAYKASHP